MATFQKRGDSIRAIVRMRGKLITKSFATKGEAAAWAAEQEVDIRKATTGPTGGVNRLNLSGVLTKYIAEVLEKKPYPVPGSIGHYTRLAKELAGTEIAQMDRAWWMKTIQAWDIAPQSRMRYVTMIGSALKCADHREWGIKVDWLDFQEFMTRASSQGLLSNEYRKRTRRVTDEEIERIKTHSGIYSERVPLNDIIDFCVATAMRIGEVCRITWADFDGRRKMQWIRMRKDPKNKATNDQEIPLLPIALEIVKRQPRTDERIFPWSEKTIQHCFRMAARHAGVKKICLHNLRHEGISRLFEMGYQIEQVALMSGHKRWETLRSYTHLKPESLHDGPAGGGVPQPKAKRPALRIVR